MERNQSRARKLGLLAAAAIAVVAAPLLHAAPVQAQAATMQPHWPGQSQLFVGANYQPIDRSSEQIRQDIAVMKQAGFNLVRMGDLSWDSFEPREGQFTFEWFDSVMDQMHAAGIKVILDIPGQPAPIWLHKSYPGVDIVNQDGVRLKPATRYWDNISDPDYRRLRRDRFPHELRRGAAVPL